MNVLGNIRYALRQFWHSPVIRGRDAGATMASWHGRPGHDTKLDRFVNFVSTKWTSPGGLRRQPLRKFGERVGRPRIWFTVVEQSSFREVIFFKLSAEGGGH